MPILVLEPYVYPTNLLVDVTQFFPHEALQWWVLHTRPRAEKALARALMVRETPFFLPLARKCRSRRGRLVASYLPLFPGYVFLFGTPEQRMQSLETNAVASTLLVQDQPKLHADLSRIHQLMAAGLPLTPEERLEPGSWVEITSGALCGMKGRITRRANRLRFVVEVDFLQRGASVEVDESMISPSEPACVGLRRCA